MSDARTISARDWRDYLPPAQAKHVKHLDRGIAAARELNSALTAEREAIRRAITPKVRSLK